METWALVVALLLDVVTTALVGLLIYAALKSHTETMEYIHSNMTEYEEEE